MTDRFVIALARVAGPRLRVLRLSQCTQIGDASLSALQVPRHCQLSAVLMVYYFREFIVQPPNDRVADPVLFTPYHLPPICVPLAYDTLHAVALLGAAARGRRAARVGRDDARMRPAAARAAERARAARDLFGLIHLTEYLQLQYQSKNCEFPSAKLHQVHAKIAGEAKRWDSAAGPIQDTVYVL